ncbi:hypothetical protein KM043_007329 [Ampulex compressa]|nr:hypothetical protein KM043_007329 [Ampulex compressa]
MREHAEANGPTWLRDSDPPRGTPRPFYDYGRAVRWRGSHPTPGNRSGSPRGSRAAATFRSRLHRRSLARALERCTRLSWAARTSRGPFFDVVLADSPAAVAEEAEAAEEAPARGGVPPKSKALAVPPADIVAGGRSR